MKHFTTFVLLAAFLISGNLFAQSFEAADLHPYEMKKGKLLTSFNLVDLDDDGDLDALASYYAHPNTFQYYQNDADIVGAPMFADPIDNPFGLVHAGNGGLHTAIGDLDGDGDYDVYCNNKYFENIGTKSSPKFAAPINEPYGLKTDAKVCAFVDIDGDGDLDMLNIQLTNLYKFYENTGTPTAPKFGAGVDGFFGLKANLKPSKYAHFSIPAFRDMDGDGDQDLFLGENVGVGILYIPNTGTATAPAFDVANAVLNPFGLKAPMGDPTMTFGDLNEDGIIDVMYGTRHGNIYLQEGKK